MIKAWTEEAWEDFEYWTRQDRKVLKRILQLLKDIDRNGYEGIGKPERLSGDLSSYWSRRIDDANRIVYRIDSNVVPVAGIASTKLKSFSAVHTIGISDAKQMACGLSAFLMRESLFTLPVYFEAIL